jgi:alkylation response protein AidB-like acyl-CoA dehydrogenase
MSAGVDPETLEQILAALDDFAARHLPIEKLLEWDAADVVPLDVVRAMCGPELGIHLLFVPEEYHGMGGGAVDVYRLCERLARVDLGVATGLLATFLGSEPIAVGGTEAQRAHWLTRIADEGLLFAYGATEPAAGSDLAALRTTAAPVVEDGAPVAYLLNGRKQWISNGGVADVYTILANAPGGPSWFVVEKDAPGLDHGKPEDKHGIRASNTAAVLCDDVRVGVDRLVGGVEGQGLLQAQSVFGYTRLMVAAFGLGAGWAALDRILPFALDRVQGGAPLAEKQGYTHKLLVPHAARLEAARAYIEETAARIDGDPHGNFNTEGAIAKYLATEFGNAAAESAIQALGGYGYTREYVVEKIKRDVRITTIYEGTSEIMEMTISRDRWQTHIKTRGAHYHDAARELEALAAGDPDSGAGTAALALHALAEVLERARIGRLTRNQHVLLRLGELVAWGEAAASVARRAARARSGSLDAKADRRFAPPAAAALARIFVREAALKIAADGVRWLASAEGVGPADVAALGDALRLGAIHQAQQRLLTDMDGIADVLFGRTERFS